MQKRNGRVYACFTADGVKRSQHFFHRQVTLVFLKSIVAFVFRRISKNSGLPSTCCHSDHQSSSSSYLFFFTGYCLLPFSSLPPLPPLHTARPSVLFSRRLGTLWPALPFVVQYAGPHSYRIDNLLTLLRRRVLSVLCLILRTSPQLLRVRCYSRKSRNASRKLC